MENERSEVLRMNLLEAAALLLEHDKIPGRSILETLPGGARLAIEIEILPPRSESSEAA
jgi:hypothetical protein